MPASVWLAARPAVSVRGPRPVRRRPCVWLVRGDGAVPPGALWVTLETSLRRAAVHHLIVGVGAAGANLLEGIGYIESGETED